LNFPLNLEITDASRIVIQKIKELGGEVKCIYRTPLTLKAHIHPERYCLVDCRFPLPMDEPIPPVRRVTQLDRIESRGAIVVFRKPKWKESAGPKIIADKAFVYPANRSPGTSIGRVRKRRQPTYRTITYSMP